MKGRSFDTFQVAPGNQEAYTVCRRIALLEEMGPALVVLLGPEACGKSHLLWAIAKQVRAGTLPAGLALITPDDIPEKVRGLVEDSTPLQGRRAILLVDGLERFDTEARRLDAVIETFLAYQHPVVIASSVHPNRLDQLPVSLVNRLASARVVAMEPRLVAGDGKAADRVRALEEAAQELQRQRDALQEQLEASGLAAGAAQRAAELAEARGAALQQQADATAAEGARLEASLAATVAEKQAVERKAAVIQADAVAARDQLGEAMKALEEATSAQAAAEGQIALFQEEAEYAMAQQARLQGELSALRMDAEEGAASDDTTALQAELAQAQRIIAEAVESLTVMGQQHASLCHDLESDVKDLVSGLNTASVERATEAGQAAQLRDALSDAKLAQQQMRDTLVGTRERLKGVEFEWAKTRKVLAIQTAEMDALRYETASQMAQASIQAGELEHRIGLLEAAFDSLRATKPEVGSEDGAAARTWSMALENMQAQLLALREARAQNKPERMAEEQAHFEDDFFEALPEGFDAADVEKPNTPLPGDNGALKDALEGAMGTEATDAAPKVDGAALDITD